MKVILEVWEDVSLKGESLCDDSYCLAVRHFNSQDKTGRRDKESHLQGQVPRAGDTLKRLVKECLLHEVTHLGGAKNQCYHV